MHRIMNRKETKGDVIRFVRENIGQIIYYSCVALVLTAVAIAAQRLRPGSEMKDSLILPAAELSVYTQEETEPELEIPKGMLVLRPYAHHPEWNAEYSQWETHTATDFTCIDDKVYSLSDGMVKTIGESGVYGGFIEIEVEDMLLRYAAIEPMEIMKVGDKVEKGDVLGTADGSMPSESHLEKHVHLELIRNGNYLDIANELKKS